MKKLLYVLTSALLLVGFFTSCEKPEKANSTIKGVVTDKETNTPLVGVTIELHPIGKQVQTAEDGSYIIKNLKEGTYTLKAQKDGYVNYVNGDVQLIDNQIIQLDITLCMGYTETAFGLNMDLIYVEGGTFKMGATAEQRERGDAYDNEYPERVIKLDGYHIGKYEVTQAQWKAVMGTTIEQQRANAPNLYGVGDEYPMYYVSWSEVQEFCKKLSEKTGKKYVLPTEAQWEYAARGGNKSRLYKYAGSNDIDDVAWYWENSGEKTYPVGIKKANELGIYDMSGNVWEWCSDWYAEYDKNDTDNPQGPAYGSGRVARGGGWNILARRCRVSVRFYALGGRDSGLGFRVAVLP